MNKLLACIMVALVAMVMVQTANSFRPLSVVNRAASFSSRRVNMAVTEVTSINSLDQVVKDAGEKLIVIDYSTTWCGPCKIALPKFVDLSDKHEDVIFLKCIGDTSTEASQLMKREGVRSVPSFHFWKAGAKIEVVNGARIEDVEAAVNANK